MKISSVSKKVICSALSAAMVVAFAPTVALGAVATGNAKISVTYDFDGGTDLGSDTKNFLKEGEVPTVIKASKDDSLYTSAPTLKLWFGLSSDQPSSIDFSSAHDYYNGAAGGGLAMFINFDGDDPEKVEDLPEGTHNYTTAVKYAAGTDEKVTGTLRDNAADAIADADEANTCVHIVVQVMRDDTVVMTKDYDYEEVVYNYDSFLNVQVVENAKDGYAQLRKGSYLFDKWVYYIDANGDGDYEDAEDGDVNGDDVIDDIIEVWDGRIGTGAKVLVKAVYSAPEISSNFHFANKNTTTKNAALLNQATIEPEATFDGTYAKEGVDYTVTLAKDGAEIATKTVGATAKVTFDEMAAEVGTYTMTLKDATNGYVLDTEELLVGAVEISGGYFKSRANAGVNVETQTVYYEANDEDASTEKSISSILSSCGIDIQADKDGVRPATGLDTDAAVALFNSKGEEVVTFGETTTYAKTVKNGAITTQLTSFFGEDGIISATESNGKFTVATYHGATSAAADYYLTLADPSGAIVKENSGLLAYNAGAGTGIKGFKGIDTDDKNDFATAFDATKGAQEFEITIAADKLVAGDYTVTLYKVTAGTDTTDATVKAVESKTVTVSTVAAPTWAYTADEDVTKGGTLVLTNNAGDKYDVKYGTSTASSKYNQDVAGIKVTSFGGKYVFQAVKNSSAKKTDPNGSATVTIWGYDQDGAMTDVTTFAAQAGVQTVNGSKTVTYGADEGVKAAVAAAKKAFTDAGFAEGKTAGAAWAETVKSGERSVLAAVAEVAQAEVDALYAGVADKDGNVTKISTDNYEKATAAVAAVLTAFDKNSDGDIANNVAKVNDVKVSDNTGAQYAAAVDAAVKAAQAAAVKYAAADVEAAAAVTEALKAATTGEAAEAAIKAYAALTDVQKELVSLADVAAAEAVKDAADKAAAEEEAKKAEEEAAAALVAQQDKAAVNYCNSTKSKTITLKKGAKKTQKAQTVKWNSKVSASGNVVTYSWKSGSTRITVAAGGVATLKKGTKAGTYKAKVTVTCGEQTRTVTAKFIVKK